MLFVRWQNKTKTYQKLIYFYVSKDKESDLKQLDEKYVNFQIGAHSNINTEAIQRRGPKTSFQQEVL